ncbi:hypothetical protein Tco_0603517 [Tanacetum coccineum]
MEVTGNGDCLLGRGDVIGGGYIWSSMGDFLLVATNRSEVQDNDTHDVDSGNQEIHMLLIEVEVYDVLIKKNVRITKASNTRTIETAGQYHVDTKKECVKAGCRVAQQDGGPRLAVECKWWRPNEPVQAAVTGHKDSQQDYRRRKMLYDERGAFSQRRITRAASGYLLRISLIAYVTRLKSLTGDSRLARRSEL